MRAVSIADKLMMEERKNSRDRQSHYIPQRDWSCGVATVVGLHGDILILAV